MTWAGPWAGTAPSPRSTLRRWGNPDGHTFGNHRSGAILDDEARFGGFTLARRVTAGWHRGTDRWADGQFIRYTIDDARCS